MMKFPGIQSVSMRTCGSSLMLAFLFGCASVPNKAVTEAVAIDPARYPTTQYVIGQGTGRTLEFAKDRARSDIAKQFRVEVTAQTRTQTEVNAQIASDGVKEQVSQRAQEIVSSFTELALEGIEIVNTQEFPKAAENERFAVVATLNKARLRQQLLQAIANEDEKLNAALQRANSSAATAHLTRAQALGQAQQALQARQTQVPLLQTVGGSAPAAPISAVALDERLLVNAKALRIHVDANEARVLELASNALAYHGLARESETAANVSVRVQVQTGALAQRDGQYLLTGSLNVQITADQTVPFRANCRIPLRKVAGSEGYVRTLFENEQARVLQTIFGLFRLGVFPTQCS